MGFDEHEKKWHDLLKPLIIDNKEITPEMWQQMGRLNSATFLHQQMLNLPTDMNEQVD